MRVRVDWRASVSLTGRILKYLSVAFLVPIAVSLLYSQQDLLVFVATMAGTVTAGALLERVGPAEDPGPREAFLMVGLTWLLVAVVGAAPYVLAGSGTVASPVNALFESMSGFTTTGATVMRDISVDAHSRELMMWRQLTQWLGGMGIVVLAVAILTELSVGGAQLMEAEAPGPGIEKLTPQIAETARALWLAYIGFSVAQAVLLYLLGVSGLAPEMTAYGAIAHTFTTMPTGGFSPQARSIEAFSWAVQWAIIPFMVVAGTNFVLFWHVLTGDWREAVEDSEVRFYAGCLASLSAIVSVLLFVDNALVDAENVGRVAGLVEPSIRHAAFQIVSIVTTTGYASMNFDVWSPPAQYVLVFAMFLGGSAGSTGGGIKMIRWLVILKSIRRELFTTVHPEAVRPVRLAGRSLDENAVRGIYTFTLLYFVVFLVGTLLLAVDAARVGGIGIEVIGLVTATAATLGNIGPGLGMVGPMGNYLQFPWSSRLLMVGLMWIGRLEIFPVLVLLTRAFWRS
ncbi:trk system potassium uptake protein TrkH [Natronoarchaeum philippinense]|uniref:Trk system potassium uptake protein TrkH n=1 Tax=Natronoarchaeum philippinense TaxID=558529 RepID=A0A285MZF5_NATPI|nr:TrkH family potassium uptake protein [Natronoarchaeum philippinense]SNZ02575.1 trk system potassium uptake protein TrkH [Natronoarchaeum philippinense]